MNTQTFIHDSDFEKDLRYFLREIEKKQVRTYISEYKRGRTYENQFRNNLLYNKKQHFFIVYRNNILKTRFFCRTRAAAATTFDLISLFAQT